MLDLIVISALAAFAVSQWMRADAANDRAASAEWQLTCLRDAYDDGPREPEPWEQPADARALEWVDRQLFRSPN